jgi:histidinol phosphatase-like enzyme (inositol monophosphatase family)
MMDNYAAFRDFAEELAGAARSVIRAALNAPFETEIKPDQSPVTEVDKAVEDRIRTLIDKCFPDHGVLGEERPDTNPDAEFKWVIDPIDGTLPFLAGIPVFGTLIALVHGDDPVIGVIDMPVTGDRWVGCKGATTTRNGEMVRTRACDRLSNALMASSNPNFWGAQDRPALDRLTAATRWGIYGGSCLAHAQIASARVDMGIEVGYDIHDYLALVPVISGAGGVITDWHGAPLTIRSGDRFVSAGDARIHQQALNILAVSH